MAKRKGQRGRRGDPPEETSPGEQTPRDPKPFPHAARPRALALSLAVALAAVHALWALFQWVQLIFARRGGDFFCGLGEAEGCATVWDSPLAAAVQHATGLPVAAWGLVWSFVAFALPLWALTRRARGRILEPAWTATLLTALGGIGGVLVLAAASLSVGELCSTCAVTYALVLVYGAICLSETERIGFAQIRRGAVPALAGVLVSFLILLYPGLQTPQGSREERLAFLEAARRAAQESERRREPVEARSEPQTPAEPVEEPTEPANRREAPAERPIETTRRDAPTEPQSARGEAKPDAAKLEELIGRLSPPLRQGLADALATYASEKPVPARPARQLIGPTNAPVRITQFTDILCSHCADLHEVTKLLEEMLPEGSFALEPRQFPLDSACNSAVEVTSEGNVRCLAARALICIDGDLMAYSDALFEKQRWLTEAKIYELAAPYMPRDQLEACVASPETQEKLADDISWALEHEIRGTPLVLVNGRKAPAALHFLYAMVLAGANPEHPAFAALPKPSASVGLP